MEIQIKAWEPISNVETLGLEHVGTGLEEKGSRGWESWDFSSREELREADPCKHYGAGQCPERLEPSSLLGLSSSIGPQPLSKVLIMPSQCGCVCSPKLADNGQHNHKKKC